ncbi:MAG: hypothetical protein LBT59_16630 [Clostridiales bacterium]|nr:hypothetical protein [Clostridiales bacterium]
MALRIALLLAVATFLAAVGNEVVPKAQTPSLASISSTNLIEALNGRRTGRIKMSKY